MEPVLSLSPLPSYAEKKPAAKSKPPRRPDFSGAAALAAGGESPKRPSPAASPSMPDLASMAIAPAPAAKMPAPAKKLPAVAVSVAVSVAPVLPGLASVGVGVGGGESEGAVGSFDAFEPEPAIPPAKPVCSGSAQTFCSVAHICLYITQICVLQLTYACFDVRRLLRSPQHHPRGERRATIYALPQPCPLLRHPMETLSMHSSSWQWSSVMFRVGSCTISSKRRTGVHRYYKDFIFGARAGHRQ